MIYSIWGFFYNYLPAAVSSASSVLSSLWSFSVLLAFFEISVKAARASTMVGLYLLLTPTRKAMSVSFAGASMTV
jgi:hypothetical protein